MHPQADPKQLHILILAAGKASRFGSPKQLAQINNKSFIQYVIDCALELVEKQQITVVTGCYHQQIHDEIHHFGLNIVENKNWQQGMGSSISAGIQAMPANTAAVLILSCDQVLITAQQLQQLISQWHQHEKPIVVSQYGDTIGIPVIISQEFFLALQKLAGDNGAKQLLQANEDRLYCVELAAAQYDIDSRQDMIRAGISPA